MWPKVCGGSVGKRLKRVHSTSIVRQRAGLEVINFGAPDRMAPVSPNREGGANFEIASGTPGTQAIDKAIFSQ